MEKIQFGLIGYPLSHSFSKKYFDQKFAATSSSAPLSYALFPLAHISDLPELLAAMPNLVGFNVTIPYKEKIIPYLSALSPEATAIGAVNVVVRHQNKLLGYNTDAIGFAQSIQPLLRAHHTSALVLGNGGAAKAVCYVLQQLGIHYTIVSRTPTSQQLHYAALLPALLQKNYLIINTTPLGMYPNVETAPEIPYEAISEKHILYDLVYNPAETLFLQKGKKQGAATQNGLEMLHLQAEAAWDIWQHKIPLYL
ncbi:MAG: shikimate dehydrogenase [Chitinophagales bacterium]|nr:shikimate dehydrogenase [Bacteroidota bacterium]MCB9042167.1 shikimate dehydrogenase [Chitinophagales bacterium]